MTYEEAKAILLNGGKIRRKSWLPKVHIYRKGTSYALMIIRQEGDVTLWGSLIRLQRAIESVNAISYDGWELYTEEIKKKVIVFRIEDD